MTVRIAQRILSRFKLAFSKWHAVDWGNSVVEITTVGVEVWHVDQSQLIRDGYLAYDSKDWTVQLLQLLQNNAATRSS